MVIFFIIAGILLGFLSALGVGGGSLLILWLTVVLDHPQPEARLMNLMFFIPCALVASLFRFRQGMLNLHLTVLTASAGLAGALLASSWRNALDAGLLEKALGILFLLCGIRELCYRPRELR